MGNPVVHFDLTGPEAELAAKFYGELFGWHVQTFPMPDGSNYNLIDTHAGGGINGGIAQARPGQPAFTAIYVEDDDIQALLDKAVKLGATVQVPVTEMEMVTFALFADPAGRTMGLVKSDPTQESPGVSPGDKPAVAWFELLGGDVKASWKFYGELFGWKVKDVSSEGFEYGEVDTGAGRGIQGGIGSSQDGKPKVNIYAEVDDLQEFLDRAEALGGKTVTPPIKASTVEFAQFQDPQGTVFGLYKQVG